VVHRVRAAVSCKPPRGTNEIDPQGIRLTDTLSTPATVLLSRLLARGKFRHLQVLLRLAELGSVQRAADAIGVTQSSVTQTLAYLETLLDARLFQRHARGVTPTPTCVDLLPVARQVMMGLAESADVLVSRQRQGGGVVRLLASSAGVHSVLLKALPPFHQAHPAVQVHLREAEGEDQLLAVARGEVDLAVCRRPVALPEGWNFQPRVPDRFVVVCAPGHPVLRRRREDWKSLGREVWLLAPAESAARLRFDEVAQHFEGPVRTHPLVTRVFASAVATLQHDGVLALLPLSFVQHLLDAGDLALVPTATDLPLAPIGVMSPQVPVGAAAGLLIEHLLREPPR
jgi:DNA-binding transcriptional LysR family regulator